MSEVFTNRAKKGTTLTNAEGDTAVGSPSVTQTAHGFAVGDVVRRSSATEYAKAQADSESNVGVGLSYVFYAPDANTFSLMRAGNSHIFTESSHGFGVFGTKLWLSQGTAGAKTATEPTSGLKVYLGYVIDANTICWEPGLKVSAE